MQRRKKLRTRPFRSSTIAPVSATAAPFSPPRSHTQCRCSRRFLCRAAPKEDAFALAWRVCRSSRRVGSPPTLQNPFVHSAASSESGALNLVVPHCRSRTIEYRRLPRSSSTPVDQDVHPRHERQSHMTNRSGFLDLEGVDSRHDSNRVHDVDSCLRWQSPAWLLLWVRVLVAAGPDPAVLPSPSWLAAHLASDEGLLLGGFDALKNGVRAVVDPGNTSVAGSPPGRSSFRWLLSTLPRAQVYHALPRLRPTPAPESGHCPAFISELVPRGDLGYV